MVVNWGNNNRDLFFERLGALRCCDAATGNSAFDTGCDPLVAWPTAHHTTVAERICWSTAT
eukprot:6183145-Pleurochrysis_carterae.AAC.1